MRGIWVGLALVGVLVLPGCAGADGEAGSGPGSVVEDGIDVDITLATSAVDRFWGSHWPDLFTGSYRAPRVVGGYDGADPDAPRCGGRPLVDDNAVYCPGGDFLAWDVDLMEAGYRSGDAWVYLVIAHEWGHAIQARLNERLVTLDAELQADCLAGAAIFGAARDQSIAFEEGDTQELVAGLTALADDTPWTRVGDHGDAEQRVDAFARGGRDGVTACVPRR